MSAQDELETATRLLRLALTVFPDQLPDSVRGREMGDDDWASGWERLSDKAQMEVKYARGKIMEFLKEDEDISEITDKEETEKILKAYAERGEFSARR